MARVGVLNLLSLFWNYCPHSFTARPVPTYRNFQSHCLMDDGARSKERTNPFWWLDNSFELQPKHHQNDKSNSVQSHFSTAYCLHTITWHWCHQGRGKRILTQIPVLVIALTITIAEQAWRQGRDHWLHRRSLSGPVKDSLEDLLWRQDPFQEKGFQTLTLFLLLPFPIKALMHRILLVSTCTCTCALLSIWILNSEL